MGKSLVIELLSIPTELLERSPFELSGGQKRTVALASLLIDEPKLLILDEPTVGLDTETKEIFLSLLKKLKDSGLTILQSSHIMEDVAEYGDSVTVISNNRITAHGKPEDILLSREILTESGLEPPEILQFYEVFQEFGLNLPKTSKVSMMLMYLMEAKNEK